MAKPSRSIGVDEATGQPSSAPDGPYITDRSDDSRRRQPVRKEGERSPANTARQHERPPDLASRRKGPAQP